MGIAEDYHAVRRQGQRAAPDKEPVWQVVVTKAPATSHALVRIRTLHGANGRRGIELGEATWVKPEGKEKPSKGDVGVCIKDETGQPWVVGWENQASSQDEASLNARINALEAKLPSLVSTLPTKPVDGEEVFFQTTAMAAAGVVWKLRFRSASSSTDKWEFVGGPPMNVFDGAEHHLETPPIMFSTISPNTSNAITIPRAGEYDISIGMWYLNEGASNANFIPVVAEVAKPTTAIVSYGNAVTIASGSAQYLSVTATIRIGGLIAGTAITPATQVNSEKLKYDVLNARLSVLPVRVI